MLNYLSAEFWRIGRRKGSLILCGVYLALVALTGILWSGGSFSQVLEVFQDFLVIGLYLCFPIASLVDGELWRSGTPLGNEVSYGLPRWRIYLGKFLTAFLFGLILFLLTAAVFLSVTVTVNHGWTGGEEALLAWAGFLQKVLIALPRYVGALALAHFLCFSLRPGGLAAVLYYLYIMLVEVFLGAMKLHGFGALDDVLNGISEAVRPYLFCTGFFGYGVDMPRPGVGQSVLTGLLWLGATTAVGLAVFRRREIK